MVRMTPSSTKSSTPPTGASSLQDHKLDLYAVKFVPSWLQRINSLPASQRLYSPLPAYTDFEEYSQSFLPKHHYKTCSSTQFLGQIKHQRYALDTVPDGPQVPLEQLDIRNYATHFRSALIEERRATAEGFKQYNQYQVQLEPFPPQHDRYTLSVPGLRENIPEIFIGDFISIRAIRGSASSLFDGIEYVAYIWAIDRKNEYLVLLLPDLNRTNLLMFNIPKSFNVQFYPRNTIETYQMMAADYFAQRLAVDEWTKRMLFPEEHHGIWLPQRELGRINFNVDWIDKELNHEQQNCVDAILSESYGDLPFLIYGPPGTGKTKTVIEAILQLVKRDDVHVLAVAPSPSAADTIALRLTSHLKPGEMFRLNDITRTFPEVDEKLLIYCHMAESYFSLPPWEMLMAAKVVVTDCMSSFELIKARCTNRDIACIHDLYSKAFGGVARSWHWTHLFVDEAAQAREPETLIPMMIVVPGASEVRKPPRLVLAGDAHQLGPQTVSPIARENGLDVSLLQRLLQRPIYADHPLSRRNMHKRYTKEGWYRPAFVNLVRNYRSHPGILMMPSGMFYNSTLIPEAKSTSSLTTWSGLPNPRIPVLFHPSSGEEVWIQDTEGWYNPSEIAITTNLLTNLVDNKNTEGTQVLPDQIAVIAPFREHVVRMRNVLRRTTVGGLKLGRVNVGTVENYQGGEIRVAVLNCVRSRERFLHWDKKKGRGVIGEIRRFNVAITRAMELLIIIGNPNVLQTDDYWRQYLSFIKRNNLFAEPFVFLDKESDKKMSSLERGMRIRDEVLRNTRALGDGKGGLDADIYNDEGTWSVGAVLEKLALGEDGDDMDALALRA